MGFMTIDGSKSRISPMKKMYFLSFEKPALIYLHFAITLNFSTFGGPVRFMYRRRRQVRTFASCSEEPRDGIGQFTRIPEDT